MVLTFPSCNSKLSIRPMGVLNNQIKSHLINKNLLARSIELLDQKATFFLHIDTTVREGNKYEVRLILLLATKVDKTGFIHQLPISPEILFPSAGKRGATS